MCINDFAEMTILISLIRFSIFAKIQLLLVVILKFLEKVLYESTNTLRAKKFR